MSVKIECDKCGIVENIGRQKVIHSIEVKRENNRGELWKGHLCEKCIEDVIAYIPQFKPEKHHE